MEYSPDFKYLIALFNLIDLINSVVDWPVTDFSFLNKADLLIAISLANVSTVNSGLSIFFLIISIDFFKNC